MDTSIAFQLTENKPNETKSKKIQTTNKKPHNPEPTTLCTRTVLHFKVLLNRNFIYLKIFGHSEILHQYF